MGWLFFLFFGGLFWMHGAFYKPHVVAVPPTVVYPNNTVRPVQVYPNVPRYEQPPAEVYPDAPDRSHEHR
jgi:hypothetical protein